MIYFRKSKNESKISTTSNCIQSNHTFIFRGNRTLFLFCFTISTIRQNFTGIIYTYTHINNIVQLVLDVIIIHYFYNYYFSMISVHLDGIESEKFFHSIHIYDLPTGNCGFGTKKLRGMRMTYHQHSKSIIFNQLARAYESVEFPTRSLHMMCMA